MSTERLLSLMFLLEDSRGTTAAALAEALGVSPRTIYRDVATLAAAGVPVVTAPGPGGGVRLLDGWRTRLTGLSSAEASALTLLSVPALAEQLGLGPLARAAESKLLRALPVPLRESAEAWRAVIHIDAPAWFALPVSEPHVATLARATIKSRRLLLDHAGRTGPHSVTVDPLGLVAKAGRWYLVAAAAHGVRSYRVSAITAATALEDPARRPAGFSLASWWSANTAAFDRSLRTFECTIELSPRATELLPHAVGIEAAREGLDPEGAAAIGAFGPGGAADRPPPTWREVLLRLESLEVAAEQLASLGPGIRVVSPGSLRAALRQVGLFLAANNPG